MTPVCSADKREINVCAAVIQDAEHQYLLTTRPAGTHLAGQWEFPGGKIHCNESPEDAVRRELDEELGVEVRAKALLAVILHEYQDKTVRLHFIECELKPYQHMHAHDGQQIGWFTLDQLEKLDLVSADRVFLPYLS